MHESMPEFGEYCPSLRGQYSPNEGIDSCILAEKNMTYIHYTTINLHKLFLLDGKNSPLATPNDKSYYLLLVLHTLLDLSGI